MQNFGSVKDTIRRTKKQVIDQENIFANHISDKGFVTRVYSKTSKLKNKTQTTPLTKSAKNLFRYIYINQRGCTMIKKKKYTRCSTSLAFMEM